ncbi:MAG: hypothetical protein ACPGSD_15445 [Flavobacteriales bacterium]
MRIFRVLFFVLMPLKAVAQENENTLFKYYDLNMVYETQDSLFYTGKSSQVFNFFTQTYDEFYFFNAFYREYIIELKINKVNGNGIHKIFKGNKQLISTNEITRNKVFGIGNVYNQETGDLLISSMFKNNKLNGITITFKNEIGGGVRVGSIVKYKNGKYKKHLYYIIGSKSGRIKDKIPFKFYTIER